MPIDPHGITNMYTVVSIVSRSQDEYFFLIANTVRSRLLSLYLSLLCQDRFDEESNMLRITTCLVSFFLLLSLL